MRALLQRVTKASVSIDTQVVGKINQGLLVFVGVGEADLESDARYLAEKTANLRIFSDKDGKFNFSVLETNGEILVVSQFTLFADTRKGRRPSFTQAASPAKAEALVEKFVEFLRATGLKVETGRFQQHMHVEIHNDGPVTVLLDSKR